jgi:hypothetical protein
MSVPGSAAPAADTTATPTTDTPQPAAGRDSRGRFAKNNVGGPGNPFARAVAALRARLLQRVTEEDVDAVADQLIGMARGGDLAAIRLLLLYTVGKPAAAPDPDQLDAQELDLFTREAAGWDVFTPILKGLPASVALGVLRLLLPTKAREYAEQIARGPEPDGQEPAQQDEAPSQPEPQAAAPPPTGKPAVNKPPRRRQQEQQPQTPAMPSFDEILAMTGHAAPGQPLPSLIDPGLIAGLAPPAPAVSKPAETGRRAANDGQPATATPPPHSTRRRAGPGGDGGGPNRLAL